MDELRRYLSQPGRSQRRLGEALGVSQSAVAKWLERGRVPAEQTLPISKETGIPPHKLRPDIYPRGRSA